MDFELPFRNGLTAARPPASEDSNSLKATGRSYSSSSSTPGPSRSRLYRCPPRDRPLYSVKGYTIQIHATDADHSYWPVLADSNDPNVSSWHQPVSAEDPIYATWNSRLAKALVKSLDLGDPSKDWLLASWPEGYRMFRRHDRQGGDDPALQYVWMGGSSFLGDKRRFRTTKELGKHFAWLCRFGDKPGLRCACKHCDIMYKDRTIPLGARIVRTPASTASTPRKRGSKVPDFTVLQLEDLESEAEPELEESLFGRAQTAQPMQPARVAIPPPSASAPVASTSKVTSPSEVFGKVASLAGLPSFLKKKTTTTVVEETVLIHGEAAIAEKDDTVIDQHYVHVLADLKGKGRAIGPFSKLLAEYPDSGIRPPSAAKKRKASRKSVPVPEDEEDDESEFMAGLSTKRMRSMSPDLIMRQDSPPAEVEPPQTEGTRKSQRARNAPQNYYAVPEWVDHVEGRAEGEPKKESEAEKHVPFIHKERSVELALACKSPGSPYRVGELVWVILDRPFHDTLDPEVAITHWPAIVRRRELKIESKVYWPEGEGGSSDSLSSSERPLEPTLRVKQSHIYTLAYLGITKGRYRCKRSAMLPYMAYNPPSRLMSDEQRKRVKDFTEEPDLELMQNLEDALSVFAYAHQLSKHVWRKYSTFGMILDPLNKRRKNHIQGQLPAGGAARMKHIEMLSRTIQFYQCVWWGAEKIWAGELVRLAATWFSDADGSALLKLVSDSKIVPIPGAKISMESLDKPVLFSLAHIYRDPVKKRLRIMGTFLEILEDGPKSRDEQVPQPSLFMGEMERPTRTLPRWLPSLPPGRSFRRLKGVPEGEEFEFDASLLAGRYYDYDTTYSERHDTSVRKNIKTLAGKATKRQAAYTVCRPSQWDADRATVLKLAAQEARADMDALAQTETSTIAQADPH